MLFLASFAALVAVASATTNDTLTVCNALFDKYPKFLAYNPLGQGALKTAANASVYNVSWTIRIHYKMLTSYTLAGYQQSILEQRKQL